ncbi:hypothetical protein GCM10023238_39680 [Streptomyces heliomycini]
MRTTRACACDSFPRSHPRDTDVRDRSDVEGRPLPGRVLDAKGTVARPEPARRLIAGGPPRRRRSAGRRGAAWLADAHRILTDEANVTPAVPPAAGAIGDRFFEAHPGPSHDEGVVWWLVEDTGRRRAGTSLHRAREQAETRAMVSCTLLASLNVPRCTEGRDAAGGRAPRRRRAARPGRPSDAATP